MEKTDRNINIIQYYNDIIRTSMLTLLEDHYRCVTNFIYTYVIAVTSLISRRWCLHITVHTSEQNWQQAGHQSALRFIAYEFESWSGSAAQQA